MTATRWETSGRAKTNDGRSTLTTKGAQACDLSQDPNRKLSRLHLALMDRMGVRVDKFGDAENALAKWETGRT